MPPLTEGDSLSREGGLPPLTGHLSTSPSPASLLPAFPLPPFLVPVRLAHSAVTLLLVADSVTPGEAELGAGAGGLSLQQWLWLVVVTPSSGTTLENSCFKLTGSGRFLSVQLILLL